jgi:membrane protease YdiL (CAAX protease family)
MAFEGIKLWGLDDFWRDISINFLIGLGFILSNILVPSIAIGFPIFPTATVTSNFLIVSIIFPIIENICIIGAILYISYTLLSKIISTKGVNVILATLITSTCFSLFHYLAYGASLSAMGASFLGAFVFCIVTCLTIIYTKNVVATIVTHSMFNTFLVAAHFVIFAVRFH